ncbi:MAG: cytochrome b/b6 domain-containing protein [Acidobacteriota bacterium]
MPAPGVTWITFLQKASYVEWSGAGNRFVGSQVCDTMERSHCCDNLATTARDAREPIKPMTSPRGSPTRHLGSTTARGPTEADPQLSAKAPGAGEAGPLACREGVEARMSPAGTACRPPAQETARQVVPCDRLAAGATHQVTSPPATPRAPATVSREILRFRRSERSLHWTIAVPFLLCLATGVVMKLFYNRLHPQSSTHMALQWVHRASGAFLLLLPAWCALRHRKDLRLFCYNVKRAWSWAFDDIKWLVLIVPASLSRKVKLPDQHKFNAGEKLNFMSLMLTYPLLIATGVIILMPGLHFVPWVVHVGVAILSAPLILGHIFMAVVNPDTRIGLSGMFSGRVDRQWAKHHYAKWYREHFGAHEELAAAASQNAVVLQTQVRVRCLACGDESPLVSWARLIESISDGRPLDCPSCGAPSAVVSGVVKLERLLGESPTLNVPAEGSSPPRAQSTPETLPERA